jgi:hypothetical protein
MCGQVEIPQCNDQLGSQLAGVEPNKLVEEDENEIPPLVPDDDNYPSQYQSSRFVIAGPLFILC